MADTRRTRGGQTVERRPEQTRGGRKQGLEARLRHKADKADTRRTHGGHMADMLSRPIFFPKRAPYSKLFGEIFSQHCAARRVYIACPLVSFLGIHFGSANLAFDQRALRQHQ